MDYKYQGIILNKKDIAEVDRIYTIYTLEAGKIRILGKGVRKSNAKLAGYLEPLTQAEIFVSKTRGIGKITGAIVANNFLNLKSDIDKLSQVFYVFKIVDKIISEQEKDVKVFDLFISYLESVENLDGAEEKADILTLGFLFKLLDALGYRLEADKCVSCEKKLLPENNFFSASRGGVVCGVCAGSENKKIKVSAHAIKLIRIFLKNKISSLIKLKVLKADINQLKIALQEMLSWVAETDAVFDKKAQI